MSGRFLEPRSGGHLVSGEALLAARGMPRDLVRQASHRLELTSLALAATYAFTLVLNNSLRAAGWELHPQALLHNVVGATIIAVSMVVAWLSRRGRLEPARLLDLGLIYEVVVAFGIALQDNLAPLSSTVPWTAFPGCASGSSSSPCSCPRSPPRPWSPAWPRPPPGRSLSTSASPSGCPRPLRASSR